MCSAERHPANWPDDEGERAESRRKRRATEVSYREYYRRYYYDPRTAVTTRREMQARARLIAAFTEHVGLPVRRLLDAGCGTGLLRTPLKRLLPRADYVCLETSPYLCSRYGWEHGRSRSTAAPPRSTS